MTEAVWDTCTDPQQMLEFLMGKASERKLRLFGAGLCRWNWPLLFDDRQKDAVEIIENYVDGVASERELIAAWRGAHSSKESLVAAAEWNSVWLAWVAQWAAEPRLTIERWITSLKGWSDSPPSWDWQPVRQCKLLRCIFGNPFRSYPAPDHWPSAVVRLADALYNGQKCEFALHDALLDSGHPELADHFRQEQQHPKGCWVVDMILGRE